MKVLIAEDSPTVSKILTLAFAQGGVDCTTVPSVERAIFKLRECDYDGLICDLHLEDGNGLEIIHFLRTRMKDSRIILFVNTGYEDTDRNALAELGVDHFFFKPYDVSHVVNRMKHMIQDRGAES